jgi:hypothetical protein
VVARLYDGREVEPRLRGSWIAWRGEGSHRMRAHSLEDRPGTDHQGSIVKLTLECGALSYSSGLRHSLYLALEDFASSFGQISSSSSKTITSRLN